MADPFAGLQVLYQNRPVYCLAVKGALSPGNWVLFKNNDPTFETEEETSVGLILATSEDGSLMEVNLFIRVTPELTRDLLLQTVSKPCNQFIPQILRAPGRKWIDPMTVTSIAWVFQRKMIDARPTEGHQGMSNLFLLEHNNQGGYAHIWDCYPFCSMHANYHLCAVECYQERVWRGIQVIRAEIARHLGRYSEKQGSFSRVSSQVVVGKEAWQFLLSKVRTVIGPPIGRNSMVSKRVLEPGLILKSQQSAFYSTMIRFETEDELQCLSTVLGELVTVEVRKRRPKYGVVESLQLNDIINVFAGSESVPISKASTLFMMGVIMSASVYGTSAISAPTNPSRAVRQQFSLGPFKGNGSLVPGLSRVATKTLMTKLSSK